jgi:hypothetical protein
MKFTVLIEFFILFSLEIQKSHGQMWYSGKVVGVQSSGAMITHDLPGVRVYFADTESVANQYISQRKLENPGLFNDYIMTSYTSGLNSLDLTKNTEFMKTINMLMDPTQKLSFTSSGGMQRLVNDICKSLGTDPDSFDVIIVPELIKGGNQAGFKETSLNGRTMLYKINGKLISMSPSQAMSMVNTAMTNKVTAPGIRVAGTTSSVGVKMGAVILIVVEFMNQIGSFISKMNAIDTQNQINTLVRKTWEARWNNPSSSCCLIGLIDKFTNEIKGSSSWCGSGIRPIDCRTVAGEVDTKFEYYLDSLNYLISNVKLED